ncbi:MAG: hypothetical protein ABSC63_15585 [Candidatus Binataceae bacterium]|jgi:hypothetical protein
MELGVMFWFLRAKSLGRGAIVALLSGLLVTSCGGFGGTNTTNPGSTPNISAQTSFRIVGEVGTPFSARISDSRSIWDIQGVVPLSIVIVNNSPPIRISVNKLVNDNSLISLEIINAFSVQSLASSTSTFGVAVGNYGNVANIKPPPVKADPDVRFFVKGPNAELFDALVEDSVHGEIVEARAPALILFDSPSPENGGRVDANFTAVQFLGGFVIDLIYDGVLVQSVMAGTTANLKYH